MDFQSEDLLSLSEIKILIRDPLPNVRAKLIASKLRKYCFIRCEDDKAIFYRIQENVVYRAYKKDITDKVKLIQQQLIEESFSTLSFDDKRKLQKKYKNIKIYKNVVFIEYGDQLIDHLTIDYTDKRMKAIDNTPNEVHFKNGYFDIKKEQFLERQFGQHIVTKIINRKYKKSTQDKRDKIEAIVRRTYFDEDDYNALLMILSSAISGNVSIDQTALFLIGDGSSGKSFIMELMLSVLDIYVFELSSDTFAQANNKKDKILNTFLVNPQIRLGWINEFKDAKLDEALVKDTIDGKIKTTSLYADGQNTLKINTKFVGTMNTIPNFIVDGGMVRRVDSFEHKAIYIESDDKELKPDDKKHVYLKNKNIINDIIEMDLLNAWFDVLVSYCVKWMNGEKIKYTNNFTSAKQLLVGSNDKIQDFVDSSLIITNNDNDKICKEEMKMAFSIANPDKHLNVQQLIMALKQKKIEYNASIRSKNNIRGSFIGVKFRGEFDDDQVESTPQRVTKLANMKEFYEKKEQEYEARIAELEKKLNEKSKKKIKKIKKEPEPESEDEGNDDEGTLFKDINCF
jgi:hypothetical protein